MQLYNSAAFHRHFLLQFLINPVLQVPKISQDNNCAPPEVQRYFFPNTYPRTVKSSARSYRASLQTSSTQAKRFLFPLRKGLLLHLPDFYMPPAAFPAHVVYRRRKDFRTEFDTRYMRLYMHFPHYANAAPFRPSLRATHPSPTHNRRPLLQFRILLPPPERALSISTAPIPLLRIRSLLLVSGKKDYPSFCRDVFYRKAQSGTAPKASYPPRFLPQVR